MTNNTAPHSVTGSLFQSTSMEVLQQVKSNPLNNRWDAVEINRDMRWIETIEKNIQSVVDQVAAGNLFLEKSKFGCSLNDTTLRINKDFFAPNVTMDKKAQILFRDTAGLLTVVAGDAAQDRYKKRGVGNKLVQA